MYVLFAYIDCPLALASCGHCVFYGCQEKEQGCVVRIYDILLVLILVNGPVDTKVYMAMHCSLMPCAALLYPHRRAARENMCTLCLPHTVCGCLLDPAHHFPLPSGSGSRPCTL